MPSREANRKSQNLFPFLNPIALRKTKIGHSECNRVKMEEKTKVYPVTINSAKNFFQLFTNPIAFRMAKTHRVLAILSVIGLKQDYLF